MIPWLLTAAVFGALGYAYLKNQIKLGDVVAVPFDKLPVAVPPQILQLAQQQNAQAGITVTGTTGGQIQGRAAALVTPAGIQPVGDLAPAILSVPTASVTAVYRNGQKVH